MSLTLKLGADFSDIQKQAKALETTIDGLGVSLSKLNRDVKISLNPELDTARVKQQIAQIKDSVIDISGKIDLNSAEAQAAIKTIQSKLSSLDDLSVDITANKSQIESVISELTTDLSSLKKTVVIPIEVESKIKGVSENRNKIEALFNNAFDSLSKDIIISPVFETNALKRQVDEIKTRFESIVSEINVSADNSELSKAVDQIRSKFASIESLSVDITGNKTQIEAVLEDVSNEISGLGKKIVPITADDSSIRQKIDAVKAQFATISASTKIGADTTEFDAALKGVQSKIAALDVPDVDIEANPEKFEATLKDITNDLSRLKGSVITLDANGRPAIKSINELEKELADLEKDLKAATNPKDFQNLAKAASLVREQIRGIASTNLPASLGRISRSGGEATQTLVNLSRVAQDAPFGFIGIANNINPLIESFQRLQVSSKQTGTSLVSNLGSALSGAGGVGLAVGIVSSLLVTFGDRLFASTKAVSGLSLALGDLSSDLNRIKGNVEELERGFKFLQSLEDLNIDIQFGSGSLKGGLKKLRSEFLLGREFEQGLQKSVDAAFKISSSSSEQALNKLSRKGLETKAAFGGLFSDIPEIITSDLSESDQKLIRFAADAEKTLSDLQGKLRERQEQNNLLTKRISLQKIEIQNDENDKLKQLTDKQRSEFEKFQNDIISRARQFSKQFGNAFEVPDLEESFTNTKDKIFKSAIKLFNDLEADRLKVKIPIQLETKTIVDEIIRDVNGIIKEVKSHKIVIPLITELDFIPVTEGISQDIIDGFIKEVKREKSFPLDLTIDPNIILSKDLARAIDEKLSLKKQFSDVGATDLFDDIFKNVNSDNLSELLAAIETAKSKLTSLKSVADSLKQSLSNSLQGAFEGLFEGIGASIGQGGNLADQINSIFASLLSGIGKALVAYGVTKSIMDKILGPGGIVIPGGVAIAAGTLAIAAGAALRGAKAKGFADGGYVSGRGGPRQDKIPAMLSNGEFVVNAAATRKHLGLLQMLNGGFKLPKLADGGLIKGLSVSATLPSLDSLGALFTPPQQSRLGGKFKLRARDIVLATNREERSQRRR